MITLLKILLFGKVVLLTPHAITIEASCVELIPDVPFEAITSGARIQIDISDLLEKGRSNSVGETRRAVTRVVPVGSVSAELFAKNGKSWQLEYKGGTSISARRVLITLTTELGVPVGVEFDRVKVCSKIELRNIIVEWKNNQL